MCRRVMLTRTLSLKRSCPGGWTMPPRVGHLCEGTLHLGSPDAQVTLPGVRYFLRLMNQTQRTGFLCEHPQFSSVLCVGTNLSHSKILCPQALNSTRLVLAFFCLASPLICQGSLEPQPPWSRFPSIPAADSRAIPTPTRVMFPSVLANISGKLAQKDLDRDAQDLTFLSPVLSFRI